MLFHAHYLMHLLVFHKLYVFNPHPIYESRILFLCFQVSSTGILIDKLTNINAQ